MLSNHCGVNRGSANKLTNLQEQSKPSNNQINSIQTLNNSNHDDILSDNSEIQSLNNTLSATMDEKQKMLLLKIANNSIAAASAVASVADNDYGNVSASYQFYMIFNGTRTLCCICIACLFITKRESFIYTHYHSFVFVFWLQG